MRTLFSAIIAATTSLSGCTSSTVTTGYYQISGNTGKQLDRSISKNAPLNGHAFAATELQIVPVNLEPTIDERGCYFRNSKFKVVAHITYPQWTQRRGASKDLQRGFDAFSDYARLHEQIHVKIGEAAAAAMAAAVQNIAPQRTCDALLAKLKPALKRVYAKHDKAQRAFDAAEQKRLRRLFQG